MTKRRHLLCDLDEPSACRACQVVLSKENSQNAGLQPKPRTLDREMQGLEFNRRVEQGNVGIKTIDAPKISWQSSRVKNVADIRKGFQGKRRHVQQSKIKATGTLRISDSKNGGICEHPHIDVNASDALLGPHSIHILQPVSIVAVGSTRLRAGLTGSLA